MNQYFIDVKARFYELQPGDGTFYRMFVALPKAECGVFDVVSVRGHTVDVNEFFLFERDNMLGGMNPETHFILGIWMDGWQVITPLHISDARAVTKAISDNDVIEMTMHVVRAVDYIFSHQYNPPANLFTVIACVLAGFVLAVDSGAVVRAVRAMSYAGEISAHMARNSFVE